MAAIKGQPSLNVNGLGGRPKRYTEEYVHKLADDLEAWIKLDKENIFIEEFCLDNNIPESTIADELVKNAKFSEAYGRLKSKQKLSLFKNGLTKTFAHPMCALILSHSHGINQKTEPTMINHNHFSEPYQQANGKSKDIVESNDIKSE